MLLPNLSSKPKPCVLRGNGSNFSLFFHSSLSIKLFKLEDILRRSVSTLLFFFPSLIELSGASILLEVIIVLLLLIPQQHINDDYYSFGSSTVELMSKRYLASPSRPSQPQPPELYIRIK